jgi:thiol-disulfide isomerase/thioredoxin
MLRGVGEKNRNHDVGFSCPTQPLNGCSQTSLGCVQKTWLSSKAARPWQKRNLPSGKLRVLRVVTGRSVAAPVRSSVNVPSRRAVILQGLIGTIASLAAPAIAAPQAQDIPAFESGRYQFTIIRPRREIPSIRLFRLEGGTIDLTTLRGNPILLNFWASWCAACRIELPILERQYSSGWRGNLHVVAVSEDRGRRETVEHFVKALELRTLPIYLDPNGYVAYSERDNGRNAPFALYGMPITYLIASSGSVVGYMPGAADWSSAAANELIEYLRST